MTVYYMYTLPIVWYSSWNCARSHNGGFEDPSALVVSGYCWV